MEEEKKPLGVYTTSPVLELDIEDEDLVRFIDQYVIDANKFYNEEKKIDERREVMNRFFFGNQLQGRSYYGVTQTRKLKKYEKPYIDNVLKEGEDILRPLVLSRIPDLIVNPGVDSQMNKDTADLVSEAVNKTLQSDEIKKILTRAFRDHPLNFTAVIKWRWNPNKGKLGDIDWEVINPKSVLPDYKSKDNDERNMRIIPQEVEYPLHKWIMLFPKKEEDIKKYAKKDSWDETQDPDGRTKSIKGQEVWIRWEDKAEDFDPEDPKFDTKVGVLWKIGKGDDAIILDKRKDPNWDWEGKEEYFFNGQPIPDEALPQIAALGFDLPGIEKKKVYRNYFGKPRLPFIFMGYEQYGEMPLDETSRIEANLLLQENYDMRGMQITKMIDNANGKHIWSSQSGLKKETVEENDPDDPEKDMFISGNLSETHAYIKKEQPSAQMFQDLSNSRERMLAKMHISAPTRGEIQTSTATTNQIARESDFTVADDLSDLTIVEVTTKMAEALLHMMKLRYTPEHFQLLVGRLGKDVQEKITADIIEDGLEVSIKASGTDKLKAERQAKEEAQLGLTDPVSYFQDTGRSDPKSRAEKSFLINNAPEMYYKQVIKGEDINQIAGQVLQQNQLSLSGAGVTSNPSLQPTPQDTGNIPTTPQGSPRSLIGRAGQAVSQLFNR